MRWISEALVILRSATPRWILSLAIATVGGSTALGIYYQQLKHWMILEGYVKYVDTIESPITIGVTITILLWTTFGLLHRMIKSKYTEPRLFFDEPISNMLVLQISKKTDPEDIAGGFENEIIHKKIGICSIVVRNNPVSKRGGTAAKDAHAMVYFYSEVGEDILLEMRYPRWTDNPKPRPDTTPNYMPRPRYDTKWNFRTLEPNNAPNNIDFVLKNIETGEIYGFKGSSQDFSSWQDDSLKLSGNIFRVRIVIEASEMNEPAEEWLRIEDLSKNEPLRICSMRSREWLNWIGTG